MVKILPVILIAALIGLFIWDMAIKNVNPSQEDLEKPLEDDQSTNQ